VTSLGVTTADHPAAEICTVLIPGWPNEPRVEARTDGQNAITVEMSKSHPDEELRLVRLRGGTLSAITYLTRPSTTGRPRRMDYTAVVKVPPSKLSTIRVLTHRPDNER
jgi:hypothetical protein